MRWEAVQTTASSPAGAAGETTSDEPHGERYVRDSVIALPCGPGRWQTKSLFVFNAQERSLIRRTYTVWNSFTKDGLDFTWIPANVEVDKPGPIAGIGRLIWRPKHKPAYDRGSIFAEYVGEMKGGKPSGNGVYVDEVGFRYEGGWADGQFEGNGRMILPNGDEYTGAFRAGKAHGEGTHFQSDGEIYAGHFKDGLRNGTAESKLPGGYSYQSRWLGGEEIAESRQLRMAQNINISPSPFDVRLGILVDPTPPKDPVVAYQKISTKDGILIRPADARLMQLWKGSGDIQLTEADVDRYEGGIFRWSQDSLPPVLLVLNIESSGSNSVETTNAYLDVTKSATDFQPLVCVRVPAFEPLPPTSYSPTFQIQNYGWSPLERTSLELSVATSNYTTDLNNQTWSEALGLITSGTEFSVEKYLDALGVNVSALLSEVSCDSQWRSMPASEVVQSGVFGTLGPYVTAEERSIYVMLSGSIQYEWRDDDGRMNARESAFKAKIPLWQIGSCAEGEGGDIQPIRTKAPLTLSLDKTQYRVPFEFPMHIPAGQIARYSLPIRAAKSSRHEFRIVLVLADGREIKSQTIDLLYFFPNTWGQKLPED
jgi:hypothetical protein